MVVPRRPVFVRVFVRVRVRVRVTGKGVARLFGRGLLPLYTSGVTIPPPLMGGCYSARVRARDGPMPLTA